MWFMAWRIEECPAAGSQITMYGMLFTALCLHLCTIPLCKCRDECTDKYICMSERARVCV